MKPEQIRYPKKVAASQGGQPMHKFSGKSYSL